MSDEHTEQGAILEQLDQIVRHLDALRLHAMILSIAAGILVVVALLVAFGWVGAYM